MSFPYITTTTQDKNTGTSARVAAYVSKIRDGLRIPVKEKYKKKSRASPFTDDEWKFVLGLMKTKSIPEIAAMDGVLISESRMHDVRKKNNIPLVEATRKSYHEQRMEKIYVGRENAKLFRGWGR